METELRTVGGRWRWPFYVYELLWEDGRCLYIGKGRRNRLYVQRSTYKLPGRVIAGFATEEEAWAFEAHLIEKRRPPLNILIGSWHKGGKRLSIKS